MTMKPNVITMLLVVTLLAALAGTVAAMKVVVVGAGMSGLSAARKLTNHPGTQVTVLEARPDRYGGRVWTNKKDFPGSAVEMGAGWIHGMADANPITQWQRKLGLEVFDTDYDNMTVYSADTGKQFSTDVVEYAWYKYEEVRKQIFTASRSYSEDISYEAAIQRENFTTWSRHVLSQFMISSDMEAIEGAPISQISTKIYDPTDESIEGFSGEDSFVIGGLSQILDSLVKGYGSEKPLNIELSKEVVGITVNSSGDQPVTVRTRDGHVYACDVVVVAVPLGVLKDDVITFSPPLPQAQQDSIRKIGFGLINKFAMEFDQVFWPENTEVLGFASEASERGFLWVWFNMYPVLRRPVLVGFFYGESAYTSENYTDTQLTEKALQMFEKVFGESVVKARTVVNARSTRWASDPFARGAYSFSSIGSTPETWLPLSSPICPHIHFVGEYTIPAFIGNIHGAYMSGERAANEIIQPSICKTETSSASLISPLALIIVTLAVVLLSLLL